MNATKNILLVLAFFALTTSCNEVAKVLQLGPRFRVTGEVVNCEGCEVKLQLFDYTGNNMAEQKAIETEIIQKGKFSLEGKLPEPGFYEVRIEKAGISPPVRAKIYLPADTVHITANMNGLPKGKLQRFYRVEHPGSFYNAVVTSSSPIQREMTQYLLLHDSLIVTAYDRKNLTLEIFRQAFESNNRELMNQWGDSVKYALDKLPALQSYAADLFIRQHPHSEAAIFAMLNTYHDPFTNYRYNQYFKALSLAQQNSFYGQILKKKLTLREKPDKYNQHWVGGSITYLAGKTPEGKELDALGVFKQNKLTLVNFWASWNALSRWQMPYYKQIYQNYHHKGFAVIAVSFDNNLNTWKAAVAEEELPFHHISELKGDAAEEYKRFRLKGKGIPFNILFDSKGKMVGVDLRPDELEEKLKEAI